MSVKIRKQVAGPLEENCYIVSPGESGPCFLVDPGAGGNRLLALLKEVGLKPELIWLTHGHFDHIMAVDWILKEYPETRVLAWKPEREVLEDPEKNLLGSLTRKQFLPRIEYLEDGAVLSPAGIRAEVIGTPGHTVGSACLYLPEEKLLFSGDTLFRESAGRTDFPTGDSRALRESIRTALMPLPEETRVLPGHGEETEIGYERQYNFIMLGF